MKHLIIRADAINGLGSGHIMRMCALGQAWTEAGGKVLFCSNCTSTALIEQLAAFGFLFIHMPYICPSSSDIERVCNIACEYGVQAIAVDGYHFDTAYQEVLRIRTACPLLVVEDANHQKRYVADFLLVAGLQADTYGFEIAPWTVPLYGPSYALLRQDFLQLRPPIKQAGTVKRILVTFGGEDRLNVSKMVLEALELIPWHGSIQLLVGEFNPHRKLLYDYCSQHNIEFLNTTSHMAALLSQTDCLIGAGGGTCWEASYCGLPSFILSVAENQVLVSKYLNDAGVLHYAGRHDEFDVVQLGNLLKSFLCNSGKLSEMAQKAHAMVDGFGAARVVRLLLAGRIS